jgi:transcriptional regulator with XRE-family HTH domain
VARTARTEKEKAKDASLGRRIARLRKDRGFTQVELAEKLGSIQVVVSNYELGKLRPHPEMLVRLAKTLQVSADELLGIKPVQKTAGAIGNRRFQRRLQAIDKLPKRDQDALLRTIDAFLGKSKAS